MLQLFIRPGSSTYDLPSLDPSSLVAASYLQLLKPGEWELVPTTDAGLSPNGELPYLKDGNDVYSEPAILSHLLRSSDVKLSPLQQSNSTAFHSLLDTTLLPLVLHSLFSLPKNWNFTRPLISASLPYPAKFYIPASLRESARQVVDSTQPSWWGLGGEAEKEIEEERKKKAAMLDVGSDAWRERKASEGRENKETINKAFGMGKIERSAREVFTALESTLAASETPFFFSSPSPTPLDAHLSSLLSLPLYLPLPVPFLADLINASFPRLWTHTALLRRTLWSALPPVAVTSSPTFSLSSFNPRSLLPLASLPFFSGTKSTRQVKKLSKTEQEFIRRRHMFYGVAAIGLVGWAFGTGALSFWGSSVDGEVEWVEEEDEEEDYVQ